MNKRSRITICIFFFSLLFPISLSAQDPSGSLVDAAVGDLVTDFSIKFKNDNPDLVFKPNLAVLQIADHSEQAIKNDIGESMRMMVEMKLQQSTLFNLVDPKKRDAAIKEINFALSGLSDTERLEPGMIETVDYYLEGTVTEVGGDFQLFLRAIEVNTASVIYTGSMTIEKDVVIERSQQIAAAYVSPYGIGIELSLTPLHYLHGDAVEREGQPLKGNSTVIGFDLNYRINRSFVAWGSFEFTGGGFRFTDSWDNEIGYLPTEWSNLEDPDAELTGATDLRYSKDRTFWTAGLGAGYVFNLTRNFNITVGGQFKAGMHYLIQEYCMPNTDSSDENVLNIIESSDAHTFSVGPVLKLQYFISPRVALNARYAYLKVLSESEADHFYYSNVKYRTDDTIPALYYLNPSRDINGEKHSFDISGHRISLGVGFYF